MLELTIAKQAVIGPYVAMPTVNIGYRFNTMDTTTVTSMTILAKNFVDKLVTCNGMMVIVII